MLEKSNDPLLHGSGKAQKYSCMVKTSAGVFMVHLDLIISKLLSLHCELRTFQHFSLPCFLLLMLQQKWSLIQLLISVLWLIQDMHSNSLNFWWTLNICPLTTPACENHLPHNSQICSLAFWWTVDACLNKTLFARKDLSHWGHFLSFNSLWVLCILLMCASS